MAWLTQTTQTLPGGSALLTPLMELLSCTDIQPGAEPSYQLCKIVYEAHPVGKKLCDAPISMAQSQQREITVPAGPEDRIREAFELSRERMKADAKLASVARLARIYGIAVVAIIQDGVKSSEPLDLVKLHKQGFSVNVLDPLNTAGSINVLNQNPNSPTFQDVPRVRVAGVDYHPSRTFVLMNETPIYLSYTSSAFGYFGRSVYQRALYPLKSFVQTMRTDDLITRKSGVIVAKIKQGGSMIDQIGAAVMGQKRALAKEATTDDVLSVGSEDVIESMNLQNLEGPYALARKNIIENIAAAADMPAIILNSETYAEGFGEGTEDAKKVASFVDNFRLWMDPAYAFLDVIAMYDAWTPDFYAGIQAEFPEEYRGVTFDQAFYRWRNSFKATWPSLITEPESEAVNREKVKFEAATSMAELLFPKLDPDNTLRLVTWLVDTMNETKKLFPVPLELDPDALEEFVAQQAEQQERMQEAGAQSAENEADGETQEPGPPKRPFADSVARLPDRRRA